MKIADSWRKRGSTLAIVGGFAVTAGFVALSLRKVNAPDFWTTWQTVDLWPWLPLAVASYLTGHIVRGERCRLLFGPQTPMSLWTASTIVVVGYAGNNILPLRLGELVRIAMLSETTGAPLAKSFTVVFVERLLDGIAILALLVGAAQVVSVDGNVHQVIRGGALLFGAALLGLIAMIATPSLFVSLTARLTAFHPQLQAAAVRLAARATNAAKVLRNPVLLLKTSALSLAIWLFEAGLFACLLPAFNIASPLRSGILAMSVTNLGILVPSSPGFVGPFHYFCQQTLMSQGTSPEVALSAAIAIHLAFYIPVTFWGAAALLWYGVKLGNTLAMVRRAKEASEDVAVGGVPVVRIEKLGPRLEVPAPTSRLLHSIVEAIVAPSGPFDASALDPARVRRASEFLQKELKSLPTMLAIGIVGGLAFFRAFVLLTNFRPFCSLPLARRQRIVRAWAWGGNELARQFFRALRSIALMAYHEGGSAEVDGRG